MNILVALTDRYRKTYRNLKTDVQKDIDQAIDDWIKKPTNPSSNFEKLSFVGNNIYSIRSSKAGRVIMAKFDDIYFLLHAEDKQHDQANNWAKNKRIDRNAITGAIQIFTEPVEVIKDLPKEPADVETKPIFDGCTEDQLKQIGVPDGWASKILSITSVEEYENFWQYLPEDAIENLEIVRNGFDIKTLISQLISEHEEQPELTTSEQVKKQEGFELITEDNTLAEALKKDISVFRYYLHPTQKFLVANNFKGPVKVTGTAGTGKTVAAIHRAKRLVSELPHNDKPVFFTTFTKYLIKNIKSMFHSEGLSENSLVISNLHQFALKYAKELSVIPDKHEIITKNNGERDLWEKFCITYFVNDFTPGFLREEYKEVIQGMHVTTKEQYLNVARLGRGKPLVKAQREELWNLFRNFESFQRTASKYCFDDVIFVLNKYLENFPQLKPFSHVVCDEVQDFSNLELRLLRNLVPGGYNDLYLTGDPYQNIYKKKINFARSGISIRGKSFRLRVNYRTTDEIQKLAFAALKNYKFLDFEGIEAMAPTSEPIMFGESPEVEIFETTEDEFRFIVEYIRGCFGNMPLHDICFATRKKDYRDKLFDYLEEKNISCIKLESVEDLNSDTKGRVVLSTLHGIKGLEFKTLIVFGLSTSTFPFYPRGFSTLSEEDKIDYLRSEHALLYVSFSRAISGLIITGVGRQLEWLAKNV